MKIETFLELSPYLRCDIIRFVVNVCVAVVNAKLKTAIANICIICHFFDIMICWSSIP